MAVASVVCFAAVVMASYGVNYVLGKGLHSYGRGVGGEGYVVAFLVFEAAFLAVACVRHRMTLGAGRPTAGVAVGLASRSAVSAPDSGRLPEVS